MSVRFLFLAAAAAAGSALAAEPGFSVRTIALPADGAASISMDYIACDPATGSVWVPAGNSGRIDVIDSATGKVRSIAGQPTAEIKRGERTFKVGPSSATVGDGKVYVGNRADSSICAFDAKTLDRGPCRRLDAMPDGLAYVAATKEVWATTPRDKSLRVLDAATLEEKGKITLDGSPEGFAVDGRLGRFYTNLEDKDRTVAIDLRSRKVASTWNPGCGEEGPRGLRADEATGRLLLACTAKVEVLDAGKDGRVLSTLDTGEGVDDIDYAPATRRLYVGAARAARLTIAQVDPATGKLDVVATVPVPAGSRNAAAAANGGVYLAHGGGTQSAAVVVVEPAK